MKSKPAAGGPVPTNANCLETFNSSPPKANGLHLILLHTATYTQVIVTKNLFILYENHL